jgi:hypothetical protein
MGKKKMKENFHNYYGGQYNNSCVQYGT